MFFRDIADEIKNSAMSERERIKKTEDYCLEKYVPVTGIKVRSTMGSFFVFSYYFSIF